jgi:MFS family permease
MAAVAAAVVCTRALRTTVFGDIETVDTRPIPSKGRKLAILSLCLWLIAVVAGRLVAYSFYVSWRTIVAFAIALTLFLVLRFIGARLLAPSIAERRVSGIPTVAK